MRFKELAKIFEKLEATSSGNRMREILAGLYKKLRVDEVKAVTYLAAGQIGPLHEDLPIGLADKMVLAAIEEVSPKERAKIEREYDRAGDLGTVAGKLVSKRRRAGLEKYFKATRGGAEVDDVYEALRRIAGYSGEGSQERKIKTLAAILQAVSALSAKYVVRAALGNLRLGVGAPTILDAVSIAYLGDKSGREDLEKAYNVSSDIGDVVLKMKKGGLGSVRRIRAKVGSPIRMMAAQRVKKISDILERIPGKFVVEEKYDGERVQIHRNGGKVRIFSRRLDDITEQYPDVVEAILKSGKRRRFIVEGEVVAVDKAGNLGDFQTLMQRRRKYEVEKFIKQIPVNVYLFDMLYLGRGPLLSRPYPERRELLEKNFNARVKLVKFARQVRTRNIEKIEEFFNRSLERGGEGIMAKAVGEESIYRAGARAWLWIKWKKDYTAGLMDTLDLVVVGAYAGRGRRKGRYGSLLMACYDKKADEFKTITRLGAGFSDEDLKVLPEKLKDYRVSHKPARLRVKETVKPEVWFQPKLVMEVLATELTKSPSHTCGEKMFGGENGLAARFPRFVKFRPDKAAEQATSEKEINQMYEAKRGK